jgi:hypothetical protein
VGGGVVGAWLEGFFQLGVYTGLGCEGAAGAPASGPEDTLEEGDGGEIGGAVAPGSRSAGTLVGSGVAAAAETRGSGRAPPFEP